MNIDNNNKFSDDEINNSASTNNENSKSEFKNLNTSQFDNFHKSEDKTSNNTGNYRGTSSGTRSFSNNSRGAYNRSEYKPQRPQGSGFRSNTPAPVRNNGTITRMTVFRLLQDVNVRGAYPSLALNKALKFSKFSDEDKRLITNLFYTVIEKKLQLDYVLEKFIDNPTDEPILKDALRIGAAQILFFDKIPDSAAVDESVKLIKMVSIVEQWQGFVNAVLRNISRKKDEISWPKKEDDLVEYLYIMHSTPKWLIEKFIKEFGEETAEKILTYKDDDHYTCIRPNLMKYTDEKFEKLLDEKACKYIKGNVPHSYLVTGFTDISNDENYLKGDFSIQGQSSILAAEVVQNDLGMYVLDACAAPGGKTCYLAEKQQGTGRVYSWDLHEHRIELIRAAMRRISPGNIRVAQCNATIYRQDLSNYFDAVLIDAPCSNSGMMLNKPDVKYNITQEGINDIKVIQENILENCSKYVKDGGCLVYSTCSIFSEENNKQIEKFLSKHSEFKIEDLANCVPEDLAKYQTETGLQLLAHRDNIEGFFIAKMRKAGGRY